ncbi:hypothetical protein HDU80_000379 [Chytriomyces hyalinus]|nr:hypothetical protein HDU80_000379 [Chytriomyces hyalinus]
MFDMGKTDEHGSVSGVPGVAGVLDDPLPDLEVEEVWYDEEQSVRTVRIKCYHPQHTSPNLHFHADLVSWSLSSPPQQGPQNHIIQHMGRYPSNFFNVTISFKSLPPSDPNHNLVYIHVSAIERNTWDGLEPYSKIRLVFGGGKRGDHAWVWRNGYRSRRSLGDANQSSWHNLYHDNHDGSFISATSLNRESFEVLLEEFSKHYVVRSGPGKKGQPRKMTEKSTVLGLLFVFYTGTADAVGLCMQFNIPPTTLLRMISNAEIALQKTLQNLSNAHIQWPTKSDQCTWAQAIEAKEPLVRNKFGFIDSKNYPVQEPSIELCFRADDCIIGMKHNCPGSWNDSQMSQQFREKLLDEKKTLQDYGVTADLAFPSNAMMFNRIATPLKEGDLERLLRQGQR